MGKVEVNGILFVPHYSITKYTYSCVVLCRKCVLCYFTLQFHLISEENMSMYLLDS